MSRTPFALLSTLFLSLCLATPALAQDTPSDKEIAKRLIQESIDDYQGRCACPYSKTKRGRRCGKRSAYSKPGGASPLCYRKDVTDAMIKAYRAR